VFFCPSRPQGSDPIEIVLKQSRVFIGYPAWRPGKFQQDHDFREAILDLGSTDHDDEPTDGEIHGWRRQIAGNRRLVREVGEGAIVLIPRPARGVVYAGRILGFELVNDPPWGAEYLELRQAQGLEIEPRGSHLGDVVQGWRVDRWRPTPYPAIPAWIRGSLFGRSTLGRIAPVDFKDFQLDPYAVLDHLIDHPEKVSPPQTSNSKEVEQRLLTDIGPGTFEHLVVSLLQLERPEEVWMHVGGSGDGGVDGVGADRHGRVVGLLQCKWRYDGSELPFEENAEIGENSTRYVATVLHSSNLKAARGIILLDRSTIAALVVKHASRLSWARSMRISA
jgi:Restriction endonuclease